MTEYIILENGTNSAAEMVETWVYRGHQKARSSESAIRTYLDGTATGGEFVAVPVRSWKPRPVEPETVTRLKFK